MLKCFIDNPVQLVPVDKNREDVGYYGRSFLDNNHSMYPYLSDRTSNYLSQMIPAQWT